MKKAIVLLLALAMVGTAFAQVAPSISGYGQASWGYDINAQTHGFSNAYGLTVNLPLVDGVTKASTGEGVYGKASVTDLTINLYLGAVDGTAAFDATAATVSAAIVAGPLTTTIYSKPSLKQNNASHFGPWKDDDADYSDSGIYFSPTVGGGLAFAYSLGDLGSVTAKIASATAGATNTNQYAASFGFSLVPVKMVTFTAGGAYAFDTKDAGATVKLALAPADGITATFAGDFKIPNGVALTYDASGNLSATFGKTTVAANGYFASGNKLDAGLKISDTGTVAGLSATLGVYAMDVLAAPAHDPMYLGVADSISYKVSLSDTTYVTPYQKAAYEMSSKLLYLSIGTTMNLIANTTFTIDYTVGTLTNKAFPGAGFVATGLDATHKGVITLKAKITF